MARSDWIIGGKKADGQAVAASLDLARATKLGRLAEIRVRVEHELGVEAGSRAINNATRKRWRQQDAAARNLDAELRKVGKASRKAAREQAKAIYVYVKPYSGGRISAREIERFDSMFSSKRSSVSKGDGLSSFHCKFTSRGFGNRRKDRSRVYRLGEAAKHLQYLIRELARELSERGLVSNISLDPDELAGFFATLEELESHDRDNANVYMTVIIALPHELTPEGREEVLAEICALLAEHGLPHVGVLHAPDPRGDQRNFHTHIMFSLRPCEIKGPGHYAFSTDKYSDLNDETFIYSFRQNVAKILNAAMEREKCVRRFTALSDADRGLTPRIKGSGKSTVGQKHWERKQEDLTAMQRERALCLRRSTVIEQLAAKIAPLIAEPAHNRRQEIAVRRTAALAILERGKSLIAEAATARAHRIGDLLSRANAVRTAHTEVANKRQSDQAHPPADAFREASTTIIAEALKHSEDQVSNAKVSNSETPMSMPVARTQPALHDPDKRRAVAIAARHLRQATYPPLVKTAAGFSIAPAWISSFQNVDRFEAEDIIQRVHAKKWKQTLAAVRRTLERAEQSPFQAGDGPARLDPGYFEPAMQRAFRVGQNAPDMLMLLMELSQLWRAREEEARQAAKRKARLLSEARERRRPKVKRILEQLRELVSTKSWPAAEGSVMSQNIKVIARAVLDSRILMRTSDEIPFFYFASEGLKTITSELSATDKGRKVLLALGKITELDPFAPSELPISMTLFPLPRKLSETNNLDWPSDCPSQVRGGNER